MIEQIANKWHTFQQERKPYEEALSNYNDLQLNFKPHENSWNIKELCNHLLLVDRMTLDGLRKMHSKTSKEPIGLKSRFNSFVLKLALRSKKKFKVPGIVRRKMEEEQLDDSTTIENKWKLCRLEMEDFLNHFPKDDLNQYIFKHPRAGKMNLLQCLDFLVDHQFHHLKQLKDIVSHKNFPVN